MAELQDLDLICYVFNHWAYFSQCVLAVVMFPAGDAQIYNAANKSMAVMPNTMNMSSIVQYAAQGATAELTATA